MGVMFVRVATVATFAVLTAVALAPSAPAERAAPPRYVQTALGQLARLSVHAAGPMAGYTRDRFGSAWEDVDGCLRWKGCARAATSRMS